MQPDSSARELDPAGRSRRPSVQPRSNRRVVLPTDPLGRVQRSAGPSREEEQHQGGEHWGIAGEAVDEQEGDGGEPRAAPPDHREVASTRDGHVRLVPRGGERGLGGHCIGQEGLPVCRESSSQQGLWALAFPVIRSYGGAGGEVHLRDDAEVGALVAGNE